MSPSPQAAAEAASTALLLSDLHLPAGPSDYQAAFLPFLRGPARRARALFLLGDIFEYWLGDDVSLPAHQPVFAALRALAETGVRLYYMAGNRDFLLGRRALRAGGLQRLPDPCVVRLPDGPALLSHGDIWCTQDLAYQRWRRFSRLALAQRSFTGLPALLRRRIADRLRQESSARQHQGRGAAAPELDVHPAAIADAFRRHRVRRIIHGHTHRPGRQLSTAGERIVLPDWRPRQMAYLQATAAGCAVHPLV